MKPTDDLDEAPFVNEECGDTMWDETLLSQLSNPIIGQHPSLPVTPEATFQKQEMTKQGVSKNDPRTTE